MDERITEQGRAIARLHGDTLELIAAHGMEFRAIIDEFGSKFGRVPSADELVWLACEHAGCDLTKGEGK